MPLTLWVLRAHGAEPAFRAAGFLGGDGNCGRTQWRGGLILRRRLSEWRRDEMVLTGLIRKLGNRPRPPAPGPPSCGGPRSGRPGLPCGGFPWRPGSPLGTHVGAPAFASRVLPRPARVDGTGLFLASSSPLPPPARIGKALGCVLGGRLSGSGNRRVLCCFDRSPAGRDPGARAQEYSLQTRARLGLRRGPGSAQAALSPLAGMVQFPFRPDEGRGAGSTEQTG